MNIKVLCPRRGHEHLSVEAFFANVQQEVYDGMEARMPEEKEERRKFIQPLNN